MSILDCFVGVGDFLRQPNSEVTEKLMTNIIENLLAQGNSVEDLTDGGLIAATIMSQYDIDVSVDYARDFYKKYVQAIRNKSTG